MHRPRGRRSSHDVVEPWTCQRNHSNHPQRHEFFDTPTLFCTCGCNEEYTGDFDFCLGDIEVNGHKLLGRVQSQERNEMCVPFAFAKQMEITKRVKAVLQGRNPGLIPQMNPFDLVAKYGKVTGGQETFMVDEVVRMSQILKEEGIRDMNRSTMYKASDVSVIGANDVAGIVGALADGFPLHAGIYIGRKLARHRFCLGYKPPPYAKMLAKMRASKKRNYMPAHAVVLVGAGRKKGKLYYYFMNSWLRFCVRRNRYGRVIREGIGKVDAKGLYRNPIRIS